MQGRVACRKDAAFADAEQCDLVVAGLLRDAIDGGIDVVIDIVVDGEPALASAGLAPVDQPEVESFRQQASDQRTVGLKIGHGVSPDQAVSQEHGRLCRRFGHRLVAEQLHLVATHHELLRRRTDTDVFIPRIGDELRRLEHFLGVGRDVAGEA